LTDINARTSAPKKDARHPAGFNHGSGDQEAWGGCNASAALCRSILCIDPTKVVRIALANAVSVASVLLLTEAPMSDMPEPKAEPAALPDMGM
jgi:hypothetical protein